MIVEPAITATRRWTRWVSSVFTSVSNLTILVSLRFAGGRCSGRGGNKWWGFDGEQLLISILHIYSIVCLTILRWMYCKFNQVHFEICSDVNDACCDTCMDSMANDFRGQILSGYFLSIQIPLIEQQFWARLFLSRQCNRGVGNQRHWNLRPKETLQGTQLWSSASPGNHQYGKGKIVILIQMIRSTAVLVSPCGSMEARPSMWKISPSSLRCDLIP